MKIFITDGSVENFYTAVYDGFKQDCVITRQKDIQLGICDTVINTETDKEKYESVFRKISECDGYANEDVALALRSCSSKKAQIAFNYIKLLIKYNRPVRKLLSFKEVIEFNDILYKVTGEIHRLKGLLRFMQCETGVLYAPYSPDNNVTDILMRHFAARLKCENFAIHDVKREIVGIYSGQKIIMGHVGKMEIYISEQEKAFVNLWKKYYKAVNIESRPHEKQMKGSMPVRYWKFLPEKN